jgi:hypothetical protein
MGGIHIIYKPLHIHGISYVHFIRTIMHLSKLDICYAHMIISIFENGRANIVYLPRRVNESQNCCSILIYYLS